jgi:uncharacterized protein YqeY
MEANLKQKLNDNLKQALKGGDKVKVSAIRLLLSAIQKAEGAKLAQLSESDMQALAAQDENQRKESREKLAALSDGDILAIVAKEIKQRQESIDAFKKGNRQDLVAQEEAEMTVLNVYLPKQLSREEIIAEARRIIQEVGAQGPRDKGKVMPRLVALLKGKADGRDINSVVTELLGA